jgi:hypothetical protein
MSALDDILSRIERFLLKDIDDYIAAIKDFIPVIVEARLAIDEGGAHQESKRLKDALAELRRHALEREPTLSHPSRIVRMLVPANSKLSNNNTVMIAMLGAPVIMLPREPTRHQELAVSLIGFESSCTDALRQARKSARITAIVSIVSCLAAMVASLAIAARSPSLDRRGLVLNQLKEIDPPYYTDIRERYLFPHANASFIDRPIDMVDRSTVVVDSGYMPKRHIASFDEWLHEELAEYRATDSGNVLFITGRLGSGLAYTAAHLISSMYENMGLYDSKASSDEFPLLAHLTSEEVTSLLADGAEPIDTALRKRVLGVSKARSSDGVRVLEKMIIVVPVNPGPQADAAVRRLSAYARTRRYTLIVLLPQTEYEAWPRETYKAARVAFLLPYKDDRGTIQRIIRSVLQRKGISASDEVVNELTDDNFAADMFRYNWRLGLAYADALRTVSANAGGELLAIRLQSREIAGRALRGCIDDYSGIVRDQLGLAGGEATTVAIAEFCRDLVTLVCKAIPITDAELDQELAKFSVLAEMDHAQRDRMMAMVRGAPYFGSNDPERLDWMMFDPHAKELVDFVERKP